MENYQSNSKKKKIDTDESVSTKEKQKSITKGTKKKKSLMDNEEVNDIKDYIVKDVLIPTIKRTISDVIVNTIDMILYPGGGGSSSRRGGTTNASRVSYNDYYRNDTRSSSSRDVRKAYSFDQIELATRRDAEDVLDRMFDVVAKYGVVSVGDFYDLCSVSGTFTDYKYGWTDIRSAKIERSRNGYSIRLPRPNVID